MKIKLGGLAVIIGAVLFSLVLPAHGQQYTGSALSNGELVTVQFTGVYTTTAFGGAYGAGIYSGLVNGPNNTTGIICDDFLDEIWNGSTWNATAIQASTLDASNIGSTLYGSTIGLTGYEEVATLVNMMFNGSSLYSQADISTAIWNITSQGSSGYGGDGNAAVLVAVVEAAYNNNTDTHLSSFTNLWILTPSPNQGPGNNPGTQEMWIADPTSVPEGGAALLYLLLVGGVCFGAMVLNRHNRFANLASA